MAKSIQSVRGMHDVLPSDSSKWRYLEDIIRTLMHAYGYQEIRTPIVESTDLFSRSIGEVTDIVEKEMYTFEDRNGDMLTLRPEGTASCVRSGVEHGFLHNQIQRLWYMGPMFRHERPQKGRFRQFHQLGVETFGIADADVDAELILMSARLWKQLGLKDVRLELNTLGSQEARAAYREELVRYFEADRSRLDEDSLRRLETNPLRILDSKNKDMRSLIDGAPSLLDHIDEESREHFEALKSILSVSGIDFEVNPRLVRGLDYYCKTVFEWISDDLGAQGTICAGGRYDGLVEQLGGRSTPASGFAIGIERLLTLFEESSEERQKYTPDVYIIKQGSGSDEYGLKLAEKLRDKIPDASILVNCGSGSFKSQMKKADKSGAKLALLIGEDEIEKQSVAIKYLREQKDQITVSFESVEETVIQLIQ